MTSELSGIVSGLQVTVNSLQDTVSFLLQQILVRPDTDTIQRLGISWNTQLGSLSAALTNAGQDISSLYNIVTNMSLDIDNLSGLYGLSGLTGLYELTGLYSLTGLTGTSYLSDTYETLSQNLRRYPYGLYYSGTEQNIETITYDVSTTEQIFKNFTYSAEGLVSVVTLSGSSFIPTPLNKNFYYSGTTLTGITYS